VDSRPLEVPSAFVARWIHRLSSDGHKSRSALDLGIGRGRHAWALAQAGFTTFGVDRHIESLRAARLEANRRHLTLRLWAMDLEYGVLPTAHFDLLVCTRYLQRDLFTALRNAIRPGGVVLYETFTVLQLQHNGGPRSRNHLLEPFELREAFAGWHELEYEEVDRPEAVARLAARKPDSARDV
jgi:SAM-dependent methyltransferase